VGHVLQSLTKDGRNHTDTEIKFSGPPRLLSDNLGPIPRTRCVFGFWPTNRTFIPWLDGTTNPSPSAMEILRSARVTGEGTAKQLRAAHTGLAGLRLKASRW